MVKPDEDTYKALARLSRSADWTQIEGWLLKCREAAIEASFSTDAVVCRHAQGRVQAIDRILKDTRAAESVVRR